LAAQQILLQAGYDLAQLALLMGRKVGNLPTVLTGGALGISPLIAQAMRSHLPSDIQLEVSQKSIAQGAARMALRAGNPEPRTRNPEPATQNPEPASLPTEQISQAHHNLDTLATLELTQAFVQDQQQAVQAVLKATAQIAEAVDQAVERLKQGGRLIYAGAGTSGRLSFVDASELPPTFSWPSERAVVAIAGGTGAFKQAVEGAEDDFAGGQKDVLAFKPGPKDVLIGIAASGTTPYVLGALAAARAAGALSIGIANNPQTPVLSNCDIPISIHTGPEVISGSTRLKAGTAQKITLNTLSSSIMVKLGKVYGNLMVDLQSTNQKLEKRALRLTQIATGASQEEALSALRACGFQVKTAIVMLRKGLDAKEARELLEQHQGVVRSAILSGITLSIWALSQGSTLSAWAGGG
jgi:N-acetylmuramic acid 6-phosphate etherase